MFAALLGPGQSVTHTFAPGRAGWLHVARGAAELGRTKLTAGDGVAISDEDQISIASATGGELILFDLPQD
jgi:redox-sensitive bicupin YhaK (pirin superfamily)